MGVGLSYIVILLESHTSIPPRVLEGNGQTTNPTLWSGDSGLSPTLLLLGFSQLQELLPGAVLGPELSLCLLARVGDQSLPHPHLGKCKDGGCWEGLILM